ncbi:DCC1-like thiol-disulfide oxidoreductase family protein [Halosquirtibacter xylanolyticus]|uniref:thiol-disulfide oxidoreductase DCC family protein n=1 Tax=Halosquirtibacter xylanolyticus TaxID=3374599 RepID=UPI0037489802|nr:DCC1-like thiol-disulfide oxidoreductase family protein [Prolixibacteraceae bacterium]
MNHTDLSKQWDAKQWWIFFDDECMVCSFWVYIILKFEQEPRFYFGGLYAKETKEIFKIHGYKPSIDGVIFFHDNTFYSGARAIFEITHRLRYPFKLIYFLRLIPISISDFVYRMIAMIRWRPGKTYCRSSFLFKKNRVRW